MTAHLSYASSPGSSAEEGQPSPSGAAFDKPLKCSLVPHHNPAAKGHSKYEVLVIF